MKPLRRKFLGLVIVAALLISLGVSVYNVYRQVQQAQLNRSLIAAIKKNDSASVIALLAKGADANAKDLPPDNREVWQRVWDSLCGTKFPIQPAQSALLLAVQGPPEEGVARENLPVVKALLDNGADVNARNDLGTTALMSAVIDQHPKMLQLLLRMDADANVKSKAGKTALSIAQKGNYTESICLLKKAGQPRSTLPVAKERPPPMSNRVASPPTAIAELVHDRITQWNRNISVYRHRRFDPPLGRISSGDGLGSGSARHSDPHRH